MPISKKVSLYLSNVGECLVWGEESKCWRKGNNVNTVLLCLAADRANSLCICAPRQSAHLELAVGQFIEDREIAMSKGHTRSHGDPGGNGNGDGVKFHPVMFVYKSRGNQAAPRASYIHRNTFNFSLIICPTSLLIHIISNIMQDNRAPIWC